jgi:hypothetical protein
VRQPKKRDAPVKPLIVLVCCVAPFGAGPQPVPQAPAARCAALIALFDDIIVSRFDDRILMLEHYELAEAREWRHQAEAECRGGEYLFGIDLIESALERIGVVPWRAGEPAAD